MKYYIIIIVLASFSLAGCSKQDSWLDVKRSISDVKPSSLSDFQAILDNAFNSLNLFYPSIGLLASDNYYVTDDNLMSISAVERNSYLWSKDIFNREGSGEFSITYNKISYCNIVLDGLSENYSKDLTEIEAQNIKGQALFFRSIYFYYLTNVFAKGYNSATANSDLGIMVRTTSNVNHIEQRSTIRKTYDQILGDLKEAVNLLPTTPLYKTRPSKPAAFALLAKTYLLMQDYNNAKTYADSALKYTNSIIDFNNSNWASLSYPYRFTDFKNSNPEIIFYADGYPTSIVTASEGSLGYMDTILYSSYENDDLRKKLFFDETEGPTKVRFRGSYTGTNTIFSGIATNEIYFIRAECNARQNNLSESLKDLNLLLKNRYITNKYVEFSTNDVHLALDKILLERRKEFPFTGQIRWEDLRRLNNDPRLAKTLIRVYQGVTYTLPPNDSKYAYPFPISEVEMSGIVQNQR